MEKYTITHSKGEIEYVYSRLIDRLYNHVNLLSNERLPFSSIMGMIRGMRRLKLDYLEDKVIKSIKLSENELLMADRVHKTFGADVLPALEIRLFGEQQMKRVLVLHEYDLMTKKGLKGKDIKEKLSREYGVSVSAIEKWFYRSKGNNCNGK